MKRFIVFINSTLLMLISASAMATTSATLNIIAETTPPACTATLSQQGIIDFDTISAGQLSGGKNVALSPRSIPLTINCDSQAKLNITVDDNRRDSSDNDASHYGLGKDINGVSIGYYKLSPSEGMADSQATAILGSTDAVNWANVTSDEGLENNNTGESHHYSLGQNNTPIGANNFNFNIKVSPFISPEMRSITDVTQLDGSATINIDYL